MVQWSSKGEREVELGWLKNILGVGDKYQRTNNFIQRVIKPSIDDINTHSNLSVEFGTRKAGRDITHIQFKFDIKQSDQKKIQKPTKMTIAQFVRDNPRLTLGKSTDEVEGVLNFV